MSPFIFFNVFGGEPYSYTGFSDEIELFETTPLEVLSSEHIVELTSIDIVLKLDVLSSIHQVIHNDLAIVLKLPIENSIHKLYSKKDINAPVNFECDSYLNTAKVSRILETPKTSRILDTPKESRILETPYEC